MIRKNRIRSVIGLALCIIFLYLPITALAANGDIDGGATITRDRSRIPEINEIARNQNRITGTGIPGASVYVTVPGGMMLYTVVDSKSEWMVEAPFRLTAGQRVSAFQMEIKQGPSQTIMRIVGEGL